MLLVDASGSTDSWVAADKRVIDVEREALLLVCIALEGLAEPYSVQAFSGEGPQAVVVRSLKRFDQPYGDQVALRIAGLEPEHYTRAGAALRYATALLMRQPAAHRLRRDHRGTRQIGVRRYRHLSHILPRAEAYTLRTR